MMPVCHVRLFAATELTLSLFVCRVINTKQQADNTGSDRHKMWNGQASKNKTKGGQGLRYLSFGCLVINISNVLFLT